MACTKRMRRNPGERGFSFVELLIALLIMGIVSGAILMQMDAAQQHAVREQSRLDNFQEAREFVDHFFRDANQIGYPNLRMVDTSSPAWAPPIAAPVINDNRIAVGLVKIAANEIRFEADTNGDGRVESIVYMLNGSGACTQCLQRSQKDKVTADPLTGQTLDWGTSVDSVDVSNGSIFTYYKADGSAIPVANLPIDLSTLAGAQTIASIKSIQITVTVKNNSIMDPRTREPIQANFEGQVTLNNCSMAAAGQPMSC